MGKLLTAAELAEAIDKSVSTIYNWTKKGRITATDEDGVPKYDLAAVQAALADKPARAKAKASSRSNEDMDEEDAADPDLDAARVEALAAAREAYTASMRESTATAIENGNKDLAIRILESCLETDQILVRAAMGHV